MNVPAAWRMLRPANGAMTAVAVGVGAVVAGAPWTAWVTVVAGALAGFLFTGAGNVLNDVVDREVDRVAHPQRPIPQGEITASEARVLSGGLFLAGLVAGAFTGTVGFAIVVTALVLLLSYEAGLKHRGFAGNATVGVLTGLPFVLGGAAAGSLGPVVLVLGALAALATLGRELLKDIQDMDADVDRVTLPQTLGAGHTAAVAGAILVVAVVLSPVPLMVEEGLHLAYLPVVLLSDAGFLGAAWRGMRDPAGAQRLAKLSMGVALGAFLMGRLAPEVVFP